MRGWDTSNVTYMTGMFTSCENLIQLDLSNFYTPKLTSVGQMFRNCTKLETINLHNADTSKVNNMGDLFNGCTNLKTLDISNFDLGSATETGFMLYNVPNDVEIITNENMKTWINTNYPEITNIHQ